jgi:hydrophobic/amphiphilic exporter-1 (mainly G- bacteria), HAE1 family
LLVNHLGQFGAVTISFNLVPGASLGDAVTRIQTLAAENVPKAVSTGFQGTASSFQDSFANMGVLLCIAVLVIYMVLGILYESFIHPLTILSGTAVGGVGRFWSRC